MSALPLPMPGLAVGRVPTNHSVGPVPINHNSIAPISNKRVPNSYVPVTDRSVSRAAATANHDSWRLAPHRPRDRGHYGGRRDDLDRGTCGARTHGRARDEH